MPIGDKYHQLREKVARVSADVIGMQHNEAISHVQAWGLSCRTVKINDDGCMITADVKMDRIGLYVKHGVVVGTENG